VTHPVEYGRSSGYGISSVREDQPVAGSEILFRGGRVIDPESRFDGEADVLIAGGKIAAVGGRNAEGRSVIDATGLVVAPGFVDLHSHAQDPAGLRLRVCDGVTAAFDLEAGRSPISAAYAQAEADGSPIHFGFSASWTAARMHELHAAEADGRLEGIMGTLGDPRWQGPASAEQRGRILGRISDDLTAGAIGIGLLVGYAPDVGPDEYLAVARLAAEVGVPTFTHTRDLVELRPSTVIDGAEEIVRAAGETGAHMHHCHVNSTSWRHVDRVLTLVERCQNEGGKVTTEAYPYGSSSTAVGASFLAPERLHERGLVPSSLTFLPTGERIADSGRLAELRALDPGGLVIIKLLDEEDPLDLATLRRSLQFRDAIVASDAMPVSAVGTPARAAWSTWPLGPEFVTHPRTAGCFSRALRLWREEKLPLLEAIGRCTILPSRVLEGCAPAMRSKARIQPGADADVVVFDPETITDQATYVATTRPSTGIRHVLVDGAFVVRDGVLLTDVLPGRALRAAPA
jgi:hypothetical protein